MINESKFNELNEKAKSFKYSMFECFGYGEVENADIICNNQDLILLSKKKEDAVQVYFAANQAESVINQINHSQISDEIHIVFFMPELVNAFENGGFTVWSDWVDYFNNDIVNTPISFKDYNDIQFLASDEHEIIKAMTTLCAGQSRGFTAEKEEWFIDWLKNNDIIILKDGNTLIGYNCVSVYDMGAGATVWVRRIAVNPAYQGRGYGKNLIEQALVYGITKGAKRGFLAADVLNDNAIALYKKCGFMPQSTHGEIMIKRKKIDAL